MKAYQAKSKSIPGTDFREVHKKAFGLFIRIKKKTKRRTYVRSAYFDKEKIFLDLFWSHFFSKPNWRDRVRRAKYFLAAIELIERSKFEPKTKENPNKSGDLFHRFAGITPDQEVFYVQIKESKRTGQKWLISVFPDK